MVSSALLAGLCASQAAAGGRSVAADTFLEAGASASHTVAEILPPTVILGREKTPYRPGHLPGAFR